MPVSFPVQLQCAGAYTGSVGLSLDVPGSVALARQLISGLIGKLSMLAYVAKVTPSKVHVLLSPAEFDQSWYGNSFFSVVG